MVLAKRRNRIPANAQLPEVVVDAEELGLVDVAVELAGQRARRGQVVAERLLHDDARLRRQAGLRQALDDGAEEERRDLEVEDRPAGVRIAAATRS